MNSSKAISVINAFFGIEINITLANVLFKCLTSH